MIFYHGSSVLFPKFDLAHALEGDGKVKFGYGVYLTCSFTSAAHYSHTKSRPATSHYVYTVEVPDLSADNHIEFKKPVHPDIVKRAEATLGAPIDAKHCIDAKDFRKFLAMKLGNAAGVKQPYRPGDVRSEKLAAEFLKNIGVEYITWPRDWKNPDKGLNIAVLDDQKIKILQVHSVELDSKKHLVPGSEKEVSPL